MSLSHYTDAAGVPRPLVGVQQSGGLHEQDVLREADPFDRTATNSAPVYWGGDGQTTALVSAPPIPLVGKAGRIKGITVSCNARIMGKVTITGSGLFPGFTWVGVVGPLPVDIDVDQLFRGFQVVNGVATLSVVNVFDAAPTATTQPLYGAISVRGYALTDDFQYDAPKTVMVVGDSITDGVGPSGTAATWPSLVRDSLRYDSVNTRIVLKTRAGAFTASHANWCAGGWHDIKNVDIVWYALGTNDAGSGVADGTYTGNVAFFWEWLKKRYPSAVMVVLGPPPLQNNTKETRAAGIRAAGLAWVTAQAHPRLKFINLGAAFDRTVGANYNGGDPPGDNVHPGDVGHYNLANAFYTQFKAQKIEF